MKFRANQADSKTGAKSKSQQPIGSTIAVAILAAGQSSRMVGENKLLLPYGKTTVLEHVIQEVKKATKDSVFIVTGHDAVHITAVATRHKTPTVHNAGYASGMSSSVKLAVQHVPTSVEGLLIVLADMPALRADIYKEILAAFCPAAGRAIIVPTHKGKQGNPIMWGRAYFEQFETLSGDRGARSLLETNGEDVHRLELDTDSIFADIDTIEAYQRVLEKTS
ncbi:MAG: nucleotidyltransferase family protein [Kordiimonadaceae bacterium]|nr:nucleotidyltransferase family protein [Kordiimonadaceae bacterium]